ncbi:helix-turn-helix domain-containing protein [Endothiovibrio diazotrophicus]
MPIGERLREERERLGFSQSDLGAIGGVTLRSQGNYERGDRAPDALYLAAVAAHGVDVCYIVTGSRPGNAATPAGTAAPAADPDEQQMLELYRQLKPRWRETVRELAADFVDAGAEQARSSG